jgi:hypothetical protein
VSIALPLLELIEESDGAAMTTSLPPQEPLRRLLYSTVRWSTLAHRASVLERRPEWLRYACALVSATDKISHTLSLQTCAADCLRGAGPAVRATSACPSVLLMIVCLYQSCVGVD